LGFEGTKPWGDSRICPGCASKGEEIGRAEGHLFERAKAWENRGERIYAPKIPWKRCKGHEGGQNGRLKGWDESTCDGGGKRAERKKEKYFKKAELERG